MYVLEVIDQQGCSVWDFVAFQVACAAPLSVILLNGSIQCVRGPHARRR